MKDINVGVLMAVFGIIAAIWQQQRRKPKPARAVGFVPPGADVEGPPRTVAAPVPTLTPAAVSVRRRMPPAPAPAEAAPIFPPLLEPSPESEAVVDLFRRPQTLASVLVASEILSPPIALRLNPPGAAGVLHQ
jgi:hypothetical protein